MRLPEGDQFVHDKPLCHKVLQLLAKGDEYTSALLLFWLIDGGTFSSRQRHCNSSKVSHTTTITAIIEENYLFSKSPIEEDCIQRSLHQQQRANGSVLAPPFWPSISKAISSVSL